MKLDTYCFNTRNLQFNPLTLRDVEKLYDLFASKETGELLWDDDVITREQIKTLINNSKKMFRQENCGLWSAKLIKTNTFIGFGGFWYKHETVERQLIFAVEKDYWGKGYATEIARAIIYFAFQYINHPAVTGSNNSSNTASSRVLQKAGMLFKTQLIQNGIDTVYYELPKIRWEPDNSLEFKLNS